MGGCQIKSSAESVRAYRQRLNASGGQEVLFQLPKATVELIDEIKERQGLRSRSQALLQLIELGREAIRQTA
ncbi:ribbon-helix-helix protein, CopG family [Defluviicoccus vanus]|uniref:Ribbon-helix-helix protein, CopG family n=1 Tax=Defluviicoccus vanus TaxID=111831 RepID=A0A7H1N6Y8_9PROT|nr:ribbon-helix-helix protein, CopG family [Defluviicoccus vanus]QNT71474.1 ribbon-helix-helix protein, CopG family [Defluviicoccus vanus]